MNTALPLTEEFPANIKPVRSGVYGSHYYTSDGFIAEGYSYWNQEAKRWSYQHDTVEEAWLYRADNLEANQEKTWYGVEMQMVDAADEEL